MVCKCCSKDIVRDADAIYSTQPGIIKQKWVPSKTIRIYNKSKYFVELDIKDRKGTFLRSMNLGAMNANAGLEFENGDHDDIQTVKVLPGMVKKLRVGTWSYMITAYMNGKLLFKNRVYRTRHYPCFLIDIMEKQIVKALEKFLKNILLNHQKLKQKQKPEKESGSFYSYYREPK
ncbi:hypothetical protein OLVG_00245 [Ostreococcus lucimarinus virus OlV6]|nr:hypothetical protein OLVG_00245 [Ostreococcus lucimarinus virus OlV6]